MKKIVALSLLMCFICFASVDAQVGKFLKNVKTSVTNDLLNKPGNNKPAPEPPCACEPADRIFDVGKYKIDYSEANISVLSDGRVLVYDKMDQHYYIVKDGVTEGPIKQNDPRAKQFEQVVASDDYKGGMEMMYKDYISKQGNKYIITFSGKTYGPYGQIDKFAVTGSKDKFAASVIENVVMTAEEGKKMDEEVNKAKTDQEKYDLAMKYTQQMQEKMMKGGGPTSMQPKWVSNVPVNNSDMMTVITSSFNATMKYDDILLISGNKIMDLQGKTLLTLPDGQYTAENTFVSSDNTRYATYSYGTLTISDGKKLTDLFNPHLVKADGKIYLAYMYYSPKKNSIMQCKILF